MKLIQALNTLHSNITDQHYLWCFGLVLNICMVFICHKASQRIQLHFPLNCLTTDEVDILQELSLQLSNSSNASMTLDDSRCPVLQVGQYSTLALPLQPLLIDGYGFISFFIRFINSAF